MKDKTPFRDIFWTGMGLPLIIPFCVMFFGGFASEIFDFKLPFWVVAIMFSPLIGGLQYIVFLFWLGHRYRTKDDDFLRKDMWKIPLYFAPFCLTPIFLLELYQAVISKRAICTYENCHMLLLSAVMVIVLGYAYILLIKLFYKWRTRN